MLSIIILICYNNFGGFCMNKKGLFTLCLITVLLSSSGCSNNNNEIPDIYPKQPLHGIFYLMAIPQPYKEQALE